MNLLLHPDNSLAGAFLDAMGSAAALARVDPDGFTMIAVNAGAHRFYGHLSIPPSGLRITPDAFKPMLDEPEEVIEHYVNRMLGNYQRVVDTREPVVTENQFESNRGTRWSRNRLTPVMREKDGPVERILIVFWDVTELHEQTDTLVEVLSQALPAEITKCSQCHKVRQEDNEWVTIPRYISRNTERDFTHGICQACAGDISHANRRD